MRLIDADAIEKTIFNFWGCDPAYCMDKNGWDPARADVCTLQRLKNASTVDAVPVVRCRDCIHYEMGVCLKIYDDGAANKDAWQERNPNDFCSYGERKGGDD